MNRAECRYRTIIQGYKPLCKLIAKRQQSQISPDGIKVPYCVNPDKTHTNPNLCPTIQIIESTARVIE